MKGLEPSTSRATIWRPNQLGDIHHISIPLPDDGGYLQQRGTPGGTRTPDLLLEGSCSIQLSYWRMWAGDGDRTRATSLGRLGFYH